MVSAWGYDISHVDNSRGSQEDIFSATYRRIPDSGGEGKVGEYTRRPQRYSRQLDRLALLGQYLRQKGVSAVHLLRPVPSADGKYIPSLSHSTIVRMDQIVSEAGDFYHVENCFRPYWIYKNGFFRCEDAGKTTFFVNIDKTFSPCSKNLQICYKSQSLLIKEFENRKEEC